MFRIRVQKSNGIEFDPHEKAEKIIKEEICRMRVERERNTMLVTCFLQRPHSIPFVLAFFLFLAWISLALQRASYSYAPPHSSHTDIRANLVRFDASEVAKDKRGWIFDPIALALASGISGTIVVGCNWNTASFLC